MKSVREFYRLDRSYDPKGHLRSGGVLISGRETCPSFLQVPCPYLIGPRQQFVFQGLEGDRSWGFVLEVRLT